MGYQPKKYPFQQIELTDARAFPPPADVALAALSEIQPDGTVVALDEELNEQFVWEPDEPVRLDELSPDRYATTLLNVARAIDGTVLHIADMPERTDSWISNLAHYLTGYIHEPVFIAYAASMVRISAAGCLCSPRLPDGSPWEWVPKLRAELYDL